MNYVPNPSLEHIALVRIGISLWNLNNVRDIMNELSLSLYTVTRIEEWQKIEDKVTKKVPQLPLPDLLRKRLLHFVKPVGFQVLKWIKYHCKGTYFDLDLPQELFWTAGGTIDRKKTAEVIIKEGKLDLIKLYKLACTYCCENYIKILWDKLSYDLIGSIIYQNALDQSDLKHIIHYWSFIMADGDSNGHPLFDHKSVFESCASSGNKVATEYFLQKLTLAAEDREKHIIKEFIVRTAKCVTDTEVLCFLLSQMDEESHLNIFKYRPDMLMKGLLKWPLQNVCMEIANHMWDYLSKSDCDYFLLFMVIDKIQYWQNLNYLNVFTILWQKSSKSLKHIIIRKYGFVLSNHVFQIKEKEIYKLILQDATLIQKWDLIYYTETQAFLRNLIMEEEWGLLETFICECLPSEVELIKFKEEFEECMTLKFFKDHIARNDYKWNQVFHLSKDSIHKCDKRDAEQEETSLPKRLRITQ